MKKSLVLTLFGIFFIPLCGILPVKTGIVWYGQYLGLLLILLSAIPLVLWQFNKYIALFNAVCIMSVFDRFVITLFKCISNLSFKTEFILRPITLDPIALYILLQILLCSLAIYGISKFNRKQRKIICWAIIGFTALQLYWVGLQFFHKDPIFQTNANATTDEIVGFMGSHDAVSATLAVVTPIILAYAVYLLPVFILGVCLAKSSFAFVAVVISGLCYLFFTNRKKALIFAMLISIATGIFFTRVDKLNVVDFKTRFSVWEHTIKSITKGEIAINRFNQNIVIETNPLTGFSLNGFEMIFPYVPQHPFYNYRDEKWTHTHNDPFELLFNLGYLGFGIFLLWLIDLIRRVFKNRSKEVVLFASCILAYLVSSSGTFLTHLAVGGMFLVLFIGMLEGSLNEKRTFCKASKSLSQG